MSHDVIYLWKSEVNTLISHHEMEECKAQFQ